jgi:hypothetical protein
LDFNFIYEATKKYYGKEGQESIDPVVFFKICLVGYLNNINSDRKLIEFCGDSLVVRLFLKYDIDEALPWHSTHELRLCMINCAASQPHEIKVTSAVQGSFTGKKYF